MVGTIALHGRVDFNANYPVGTRLVVTKHNGERCITRTTSPVEHDTTVDER